MSRRGRGGGGKRKGKVHLRFKDKLTGASLCDPYIHRSIHGVVFSHPRSVAAVKYISLLLAKHVHFRTHFEPKAFITDLRIYIPHTKILSCENAKQTLNVPGEIPHSNLSLDTFSVTL